MSAAKVLVVAAHVPPYSVGSGYLRTLKFCNYLPNYGWGPLVLAPRNSAFPASDINPESASLLRCPITRSFALDSARQLSIRGRYPDILAVPDRWSSWRLSAVSAGMRMIRRERPRAIFSTYPIATAHWIALTLAKRTGIPWVADFRDPMIDDHYPPPGMARDARARIERGAIEHSTAALFTTASTLDYYRGRFPAHAGKMSLLMNGYDEDDFVAAGKPALREPVDRPLELLHSGLLYPDVRDPTQLFQALAELKREGAIGAAALRIRLRACGPEERYRKVVGELDIGDIVSIEPGVPYREALREMGEVDGLLLLQGEEANKQVPAKLFEYFRSGAPVLALLHPDGDTARILREAAVGHMTRIDDVEGIKGALRDFVSSADVRQSWQTPLAVAEAYSRERSAESLATVLNTAAQGLGVAP